MCVKIVSMKNDLKKDSIFPVRNFDDLSSSLGGKRSLVWAYCSNLKEWKVFKETDSVCHYIQILETQVDEMELRKSHSLIPYLLLWAWTKFDLKLELVVTEQDKEMAKAYWENLCSWWGLEKPTHAQWTSACLLTESLLRKSLAGVSKYQDTLLAMSLGGLQEWTWSSVFNYHLIYLLKEEPYYG